jgi:plastocyanin
MRRLASGRISVLTGCIVAVLAAGIAGCGSSSSSTTASTSSTEASTTSSSSSETSSTASGATSAAAVPPSGTPQIVKLEANSGGALSYNTTTLKAKPGLVTIDFTNMAPLSHNVTLEQGSHTGKVLGATPTFNGASKSLTLNLKAGTYTFFCSVPGHRQAGMQGTLTVE